jgi:antitoxin VapB
MDKAKIFWSGRSQAVRLPKEYRFEGTEVRIRRQGRAVVMEPVVDDWSWLEKVVGPVDEDFERIALDRPKEPPVDLPEVADFFK